MKRKLKDLKENECIKVNTLAQAKYFIEKLRWYKTNPYELVGKIILWDTDSTSFYWRTDEEIIDEVERIPASDFIKPKKSGMKKTVKELRKTCKELAETQQKTNEYLEVLNGKNELIGNSEQLGKPELQVGKWYKRPDSKCLFCVVGNPTIEPFEVYGFDDDGDWMTKSPYTETPIQTFKDSEIEATPEEVESALIKEAKRRGFKEGINIKSPIAVSGENKRLYIFKEYKYETYENTLYWCVDNLRRIPLFRNGKWAEIIQEEQTIDWSKPGQLVESLPSGDIFMVLGKGTSLSYDSFEAVCIKQSDIYFLGEHSTTFDCTQFKLYNGTITLKND